MMLFRINLIVILLVFSCSVPDLQNAGDLRSLSGNLTKILLDANASGARNSGSTSINSETESTTQSGATSSTNSSVTYQIMLRVNNMAGASGTASTQFTLNGGIAETVSTTGNAVRDLILSTRVAAGDPYLIAVASHPNVGYRVCNIPSPAGVMPANDLIVTVYCYGTTPSAGATLTVSDVVGANAVQGFVLDGDPGGTIFMNVSVSGTAYAFDDPPVSTATVLVFSSSNYATVQNISVYRAQTGISAQMNITHGLTPFTQFASINVTP